MTKWGLAHVLVIILGVALVATSFLWGRFSDPRMYWSEEQAREFTAAGLRAHGLSHQLEHATSDQQRQQISEQLDAAQEQHGHIGERLEDGRDRRRRPAAVLRWSGTTCMILGVLGYCAMRWAGKG